MTNISDITDLFGKGFESYIIGGKTLTGVFALLVLAYICFRCRFSIDTIFVVMAPMVILFSLYGYLPLYFLGLTLVIVGVMAGLGIYRLVQG